MISPLPRPNPKRMKLGPMIFFREGGEGKSFNFVSLIIALSI